MVEVKEAEGVWECVIKLDTLIEHFFEKHPKLSATDYTAQKIGISAQNSFNKYEKKEN